MHYEIQDPAVFVCCFGWPIDVVGVLFLTVFEGCANGVEWLFGSETGIEERAEKDAVFVERGDGGGTGEGDLHCADITGVFE